MFLIRSIFWISVVFMLIPIGERAGHAPAGHKDNASNPAISSVSAATKSAAIDLAAWCTQNAKLCAHGKAAVGALESSAVFAVKTGLEWAKKNQVEIPLSRWAKILDSADKQPLTPRGSKTGAIQVSDNTPEARRGRTDPSATPINASSTANTGHPQAKGPSRNTLELKDLIPNWRGPKQPNRA